MQTLSTQLGQSGFIIDDSMFKVDDDLSSNFRSQHGESDGAMNSAVEKYLISRRQIQDTATIPEQLTVPLQNERTIHIHTSRQLALALESNIPEHLIQPPREEVNQASIPISPLRIETEIPEQLTRAGGGDDSHPGYHTDNQSVMDTHISDHITTTISPLQSANSKVLKATTISDVSEMVEMMMMVSYKPAPAQGDAPTYDSDYQDDLNYMDYLSSHGNIAHQNDEDASILADDNNEDEYDEDFLPYDGNTHTYDPTKLRVLKKSIKERR